MFVVFVKLIEILPEDFSPGGEKMKYTKATFNSAAWDARVYHSYFNTRFVIVFCILVCIEMSYAGIN